MVRVFEKIAESPEVAVHGQVGTKSHVVNLILDAAGYTSRKKLPSFRLLDPGCGDGAFIIAAAQRLLTSAGESSSNTPLALSRCLTGVDKDKAAVARCRKRIVDLLTDNAISPELARKLSRSWVRHGDFLEATPTNYDFIVGNPPYVRQEGIPKDALSRYRSDFSCFYDRADLYVAFFEKALGLLSPKGTLAFICPNRFCRNNYGKKLRALITQQYSLRCIIDLSAASPFDQEVNSYPAIFVVAQGKTNKVKHFAMAQATPAHCSAVRRYLESSNGHLSEVTYYEHDEWFIGEQQWITESPQHLRILARLEAGRSCLGSEASGTTVGIGVATGADRIFIGRPETLEVEDNLLLPLVTTKDITSGHVVWSGTHIINPFAANGSLIDLTKYPRAKAYFAKHRKVLGNRSVARRANGNWYRTIDRIYPSLLHRPKLLIPDIKATNNVVYEPGKLYPHHNLYYIVSDYWNLRALQTVLRSALAHFFVWMYGVRMRAGFLRFQAQYLRRIPLPNHMEISAPIMRRLEAAALERDLDSIDYLVAEVYGVPTDDLQVIKATVPGRRVTRAAAV